MVIFLRFTLGILSLGLLTASSSSFPVLANSIPASLVTQATAQLSGQLTEESIKNVLAMMEKGRQERNAAEVLKYIAPFAHSTVSAEIQDSIITLNLNGIAEHQAFLSTAYQDIKDRKILGRQVDIRLSTDGQMAVVVVREQTEYTTQKGENFISEGFDTLRFGLVNGQPMLVSATLKGWLSPTPAPLSN